MDDHGFSSREGTLRVEMTGGLSRLVPEEEGWGGRFWARCSGHGAASSVRRAPASRMPVPCLKAGPQVGTCPSVLSLVFQGHPPSLLLPASTPLHHYCSSGLPGGSVLCWPGLRSTGTFWLPAALHLLSRIKVAMGSMFLPE